MRHRSEETERDTDTQITHKDDVYAETQIGRLRQRQACRKKNRQADTKRHIERQKQWDKQGEEGFEIQLN